MERDILVIGLKNKMLVSVEKLSSFTSEHAFHDICAKSPVDHKV